MHDDDDYDDRPAKSRRRNDDNYDDDDDRPRRPGKNKSSSGLYLILGGAGLVCVLSLVAVGVFVWPGIGGKKGDAGKAGAGAAANADPLLNLAPSDSIAVAGLSFASSRKKDSFKQEIEQARKMLNDMGQLPPEMVDLLLDTDRLIVAGTVRNDKPVFIGALRTLKPYDQEKLKKFPMLLPAETDKGVTFQRVLIPMADPDMKDLFLAMPEPNLVVIGMMPKEEFIKSLQNRTGSPTIAADLLAACRHGDNTYLWAGLANHGELKKKVEEGLAMQPNLAPLAQAKSAGFTFDVVPGDGLKLELFVHCSKDADAESLKKMAEDGWILAMRFADMGLRQGGKEAAPFMKFAEDARKSFKVSQSGSALTASVRISEPTMNDLEKLGGGKQGIESVAAALLIPAVQKVREAAARTQISNNLKQLALAMHMYHDVYKKLPAAAICDKKDGKHLLSWRVAVLPYIEELPLYNRFKLDEPWDSKHNMELVKLMPRTFINPSRSDPPGQTNYRVLVGGGAGFEWDRGLSLKEITDGTSNTLMIVETAQSVPWTKPDEVVYNPKGPLPQFGNFPRRGFTGVFFDTSSRNFPDTISEATIRALITRAAGDVPGGDF